MRFLPKQLTVLGALLLFPASGLARNFSANSYGARADGVTLNTVAIQRAIDAAAAGGGGTVVFAPGTYLTGAIFLKSHTQMRLDAGVALLGSGHLSDYPLLPTRVAGIEMSWPAALVNVYQQSDVGITGKGTIDGDGKVWWDSYWKRRADYDKRGLRWAADYDAQRPRLIQVYKSRRVRLAGLNLHRSGFWTVHICYSDGVKVNGVTIRNNIGGKGPSTDGIDIDSSTHVLVERCDIEVNDDALCLKAGRDADGLRVNRPTMDVTIRNSTVRAGAAGITIGSETSGGFRKIEVYGLHVYSPVPSGILFKSAHTRGGLAENIRIHDLDLHGVATAVRINMNWNPSYSYTTLPTGAGKIPSYWKTLTTPVSEAAGRPHFRNVTITDITATGAKQAFAVEAYPDAPLEDFRFSNLNIQAQTAGTVKDAKDWSFRKTSIQTADGSRVCFKDSSGISGLQ